MQPVKLFPQKSASPPHLPVVSPDQHARLISLLLVLITVLVYLPVGFYDFINFDDPGYVSANPVVQNGLTWTGLKWAFVGWHDGNWHPLTWLSHELDCQWFGLNAGAHHLINVLFHAANAVLLFQLWRRLTRACWPSVLLAALFAWHPLHVESVAWVAERKDVLSTFFGLWTLWFYARYAQGLGRRKLRKSKPEIVTGGVGLSGPGFVEQTHARHLAVCAVAVGLLAAGAVSSPPHSGPSCGRKSRSLCSRRRPAWRPSVQRHSGAVVAVDDMPLGARVANALISYCRYLGKLFWPVDLAVYYPYPGHWPPGWVLLAGCSCSAFQRCCFCAATVILFC